MEIRIEAVAPPQAAYRDLRASAGWVALDPAREALGLANALHSVTAFAGDEVIGCGRIVGDGGIYFYLQDVIVASAWRGRGVGAALMEALIAWLDRHTGPDSFVGLMAAEGVQKFYERYGFRPRPGGRPGMFRYRDRKKG